MKLTDALILLGMLAGLIGLVVTAVLLSRLFV
jgi:hypothetical protein